MAPTNDTAQLLAAVERLTGDTGTYGTHNVRFRIDITGSDGKPQSVVVAVTHNRRQPAKGNLNDIADGLRIPRSDLEHMLTKWSHDDLVKHLQQFTSTQLLPLAIRRQRGIA